MKKIILLITIITLSYSCSNSDNSGNNTNNCQTLHPPTWIQGTWIKQNAPTAAGYKFTADDVIENYNEISSGGISRKFQLDFYCTSNVNYTVTENITPTSYFLEINWGGIATYNFTKISATTIELVNDNDPINASYYIKQ
jgi:hypothetical protein